MSQAQALLNSLTETGIGHSHVVPDSDTHFIIDPYTRQIENTNYQKTVLMRGDHNSERFTFEIPRYVDGHDMSLCNRVIVHFDNVGLTLDDIHSDVAYMNDLRINPDKPDTIISSWLIRREATQIVGILSFSLQYQCVENDEVTYEWNTDSYDGIEIRKSKNNSEAAVIEYTNVLEQWRSQIFGAGDTVMSNITTEGANQVAAVKSESAAQQSAIELKGSDTLASIPDDYTDIYNLANEAVRTKGDSIICSAEGEVILLDDSSDDHVRGLNIYGKSTQASTTGKNLFDSNPDNIKLIDKTETPHYGYEIKLPAGIYTVSATAYADTYLYGAVYDGTSIGEAFYIVLPTETRTITITINDGDILYLYNAIAYTSTPGMEPATKADFARCPIQVERGEVATDYEPYTGGIASPNPDYPQEIVSIENPVVSVYGKNLLNCTDIVLSDFSNHYHTIYTDFVPTIGETYTLSMDVNTDVLPFAINIGCGASAYNADMSPKITKSYSENGRISITFKWLPTAEQIANGYTKLYIRVPRYATKVTFNATVSNIQLELGDAATVYEPYRETHITIPHNLHAIPVTSGGNYTDSDGQQWICDEVDLERGVLVQRMGNITLADDRTYYYNADTAGKEFFYTADNNNANAWETRMYCSHFPIIGGDVGMISDYWAQFSGSGGVRFRHKELTSLDELAEWLSENPVTVLYPLATPIETPLTADEIKAYKALSTNRPNTTIINDAGAHMKISYNADPKMFIAKMADNRAASLVEEILNDTY